MTTPIETHAVHSQRLLDHAAEMLAQGDRIQASEKIWGAAAHQVKAIADARGWPNTSHTDRYSIIRHLSRQAQNPTIAVLYGVANETHQNFFEDRLQLDDLELRLEAITELIRLLDEADLTLPSDLPMPDDRHYRNRHFADPLIDER